MTTFVICDNCGKKFQSPIQIAKLGPNIVVEKNRTNCPHCNQETLIENRNIVNE